MIVTTERLSDPPHSLLHVQEQARSTTISPPDYHQSITPASQSAHQILGRITVVLDSPADRDPVLISQSSGNEDSSKDSLDDSTVSGHNGTDPPPDPVPESCSTPPDLLLPPNDPDFSDPEIPDLDLVSVPGSEDEMDDFDVAITSPSDPRPPPDQPSSVLTPDQSDRSPLRDNHPSIRR